MNVLSLFDGISCGQIALNRVGIKYENYYASEIDKFAIKCTQHNYPNTIQLGDVSNWRSWYIDWSKIGLVTGGFPCQAWSIAGKQLGDKDERGKLFLVMLDIIKHVMANNPKAKFIIENVKMKKELEQYITHHVEQSLGKVEKYLINSALVSAQNRNRYYWTNIQNVSQPEDKGIALKDILEDGDVDRFKAHCLDANYFKGGNLKSYFEKGRRQLVFMKQKPRGFNKGFDRQVTKSPSLTSHSFEQNNLISEDAITYRKLTPLECERLQTVSDNYTSILSNTQRYKCLGNGWTVDVVAHIYKGLL